MHFVNNYFDFQMNTIWFGVWCRLSIVWILDISLHFSIIHVHVTGIGIFFLSGSYLIVTQNKILQSDNTVCVSTFYLLKFGVVLEWSFFFVVVALPFIVYSVMYLCAKRFNQTQYGTCVWVLQNVRSQLVYRYSDLLMIFCFENS